MNVMFIDLTESDIKKKRRESIDATAAIDLKKEPLPPRGPRDKPHINEVGDDSLE